MPAPQPTSSPDGYAEQHPEVLPTMRTPFLNATLAVLATTCVLFETAHAVGSDAGAISLTFGPSARGEAMGGLFVTEANDYAARWSNPGGLAFVDKGVVGTMFSQLVPGLADDVYFMYAGWVIPTSSMGTMQLDLTYLSYGKSEAIDDANSSRGTFNSYELSPSASLGFKFLPNLGVGVTVKYVRIDLAPSNVLPDAAGSGSGTGNSWAFDLGTLYRHNRFRLGAVVNNLGPDITFIDDEQSDPLPRSLRLGGMYDIMSTEVTQLRAGLEYERSLVRWERQPVYHGGMEFVYLNTFALRTGYLNDDDGAVKGWAGGFGFNWNRASFEYANVPQADTLDRVHRFALWLRY